MKILQICFLIIILFISGLIVGRYEVAPFSHIVSVKRLALSYFKNDAESSLKYKDKNSELLKYAFTDEIIEGEKIYPPITTIEEITERNQEIFLTTEKFFTAYDELKIQNSNMLLLDQGRTKVTKIDYILSDQTYHGYAYGESGKDTENKRAILIIPGSGLNQSSAILYNDQLNYHFGIINQFQDGQSDTFVFIKPNQDILAFHDGYKKLNLEHYINWHLNRGGSFSASYIVQTMAFSKYLKSKYKSVILIGLSQGGAATLLNSLQSEPDISITSSGYSQINQQIEAAGHNQIIIPGISSLIDVNNLQATIPKLKTTFLFTWGLKEKGTYRVEAEENYSCSNFKNIKNVKCMIFKGDHNFPLKEVQNFVKNQNNYELCLKN